MHKLQWHCTFVLHYVTVHPSAFNFNIALTHNRPLVISVLRPQSLNTLSSAVGPELGAAGSRLTAYNKIPNITFHFRRGVVGDEHSTHHIICSALIQFNRWKPFLLCAIADARLI